MHTAPHQSIGRRTCPLLLPRPGLTSHLVGIKVARPSRFNSQEKTSVSYGAVCKNGVQADSAFRQKSSKGIRGARKPSKNNVFLMILLSMLFVASLLQHCVFFKFSFLPASEHQFCQLAPLPFLARVIKNSM